ncbi:unnamed protein product [Hymenolepis diminuta]|uniref:Uncharacterized protein n=1 Tax=Hymenolepis diminuta TaxID=6216 RepID=A0A564YY84_HYMDI|nr:unnamed protein product [Hymenolepis diminuta]
MVINGDWKTIGSPKLDAAGGSGDAVQLSGAMKCEAAFKGKIAVTLCYAAD